MFIFATTEPHKIPITILSRCQHHNFRRIDVASIGGHLEMICGREDREAAPEGLSVIAREAGGSIRDALSLLDQVMACTDGTITLENVTEVLGVVDRKTIFDFSRAMIGGDVVGLLELVARVYERGHDLKKLYADLADHFRNLLVFKLTAGAHGIVDAPPHEIEQMRQQTGEVTAAYLHQIFDLLFREEGTMRFSGHPRIALETVLLRLHQVRPVLPIDALIDGLDRLRQEIGVGRAAESCPPAPSREAEDTRKPAAPAQVTVPEARASGQSPQQAWQRLLAAVTEKYPALGPGLTKGSVKEMSGGRLTVVLEGNGLTVRLIEKYKPALEKVCREVFGETLTLALEVDRTPGDDRLKRKETETQARQEALNHPLVADALEIFDGRIVDVKVS